jgi:hypothetical protein
VTKTNETPIPPTISITTSSINAPLPLVPELLPNLRTVDLYMFRERDLQAKCPVRDAETMTEIVSSERFSSRLQQYANKITSALGTEVKPVAISTYFPEITSVDEEMSESAFKAMLNTLRFADLLGVRTCSFVAGRLAERCRYRGCDIVLFDGKDPESWRTQKIDWLIEAIGKLHAHCKGWKSRATDVRLALELEPGLQFVVSRPEHVARVLRETSDLELEQVNPHPGPDGGNRTYRFCTFNCDMGHVKLFDSSILPGAFWKLLLDGVPSSGDRFSPLGCIAGFHLSEHPYNKLHADLPPGRWNIISPEVFLADTTQDPGFVPWLSCFLCIHKHWAELWNVPMNISLELQGQTDIDKLRDSHGKLVAVLEELVSLQDNGAWQEHSQRFCSECPVHAKA